uniref:Histone acetyltransferase n=1 Tax=Panagrolaimus sp. ES5 TaxID=591445 RepID=A0AC34F3C8_9BILA
MSSSSERNNSQQPVTTTDGIDLNMISNIIGSLPPPDPPAKNQEWHQAIKNDVRNHLVVKIVKEICPSSDMPTSMQHQRIKDLILHARQIETEIFEIATDKENYYQLLAEKIYHIQKEHGLKQSQRSNDFSQLSPQ